MGNRYLFEVINKFLKEKMVFLGGPRQVGKTTLSWQLLGPGADETHPAYLSWDHPLVPGRLRQGELPVQQPRVVLDEIHKYSKWRNLVKGLYDTNRSRVQFLVTGSARLDFYRKGGDSLEGRYYYLRLHPFSLRELMARGHLGDPEEQVERLIQFGGFPEPYLKADETHRRLWQKQRLTRVIRDDLRDLEYVKDISAVETLVDLLPGKVGSLLSIQSLREDLGVDHKTILRWIGILENLYVCYRIAPFGSPRIRAIKKDQKLYLWDWSQVENPGARFENLVAGQLLKYCHWIEDTLGHRMELRYLRDLERREVDFVVLRDRKPEFAVECKTGDRAIAPSIRYFADRLSIPIYYQVHRGEREFDSGKVRVRKFSTFCDETEMP